MIGIDLKKFQDALSVCNSIVNDKNSAAVIKVRGDSIDVCTSDGSKKYIKRIAITNPEQVEKDFVLPLNKAIDILNNYTPADTLEANFEIGIEHVENGGANGGYIELNCVHTFSTEKCTEDIAGKVATELHNKLVVESIDSPKRVLIVKGRYDELLQEVDSTDSWDISELSGNMSKLVIDKQTKNIYISQQLSKMFALGTNQLTMFDIGDISFGFALDVNVSKAVTSAISKFSGDSCEVYTTDGGKYATFLDCDGTSALWVQCSPIAKSDLRKVDVYTNESMKYLDYKGACSRVALNTIVNAIISSDSSDSQLLEIINTNSDDDAQLKLSNVAAGGSIDNQFKTKIFYFSKSEGVTQDFNGKVVAKTLKDILSVCKCDYVGVSIQLGDSFSVIKIEDKYADGNGGVVDLSQHYTLLTA